MIRCPVDGCDRECEEDQVTCKRCWNLVPVGIRNAIWRLYLNAQGSTAHLAAIRTAREHAAEQLVRKNRRADA